MLAGFWALQAVVQALAFAAGILVVRTLSKEDYAKYTVVGAAIAFTGLLSDLGLSQAMLAVGGQFASQPARLERIIRAGLRWRRKLLVFGLLGLLWALAYIFHERSWPLTEFWWLVWISAATVWFQAGYDVRSALLKIQRRFILCQAIEAGAAALRCILIGALALWRMTVSTALLANLVASGLRYGVLSRSTPLAREPQREAEAAFEENTLLWAFCKPLIVPVLFYAFQGQITVWLLAFFGSSPSLADLGALGRLGQALVLLNVCISSIAIPYFAGLEARETVMNRFLVYAAVIGLIFAALVSSGAVFPQLWLAVLGWRYAQLNSELVLLLGSVGEAFATGAFYAIAIARRRTQRQWLSVPLSLLGFGVALLVARPTSTSGAIWIDIVRQIPLLLLQFSLASAAVGAAGDPIGKAIPNDRALPE